MPRDLPAPGDLGPDPEPLGVRAERFMAPDAPVPRHRVVIAGAGVAGLEALATLRAHTDARLAITVLDPRADFTFDAWSVVDPFAQRGSRRYPLAAICADHDAALVQDTLAEVRWDSVIARSGAEIPFDSLIVALGVRREPVYPGALTFRDLRDAERLHGVIQDLEGGYLRRIAFVVPPGVTWTLPLYELALLAAERADSLCLDWLEMVFVTSEARPLEIFGESASDAVADALAAARIEFVGAMDVAEVHGHRVIGSDGRVITQVQRVLALPRLVGRSVPGLPSDEHGFIPSDAYARVGGLRGVYAVGDCSSQPIKQGGVGAQQAVVAATHVASRVGADVKPAAFEPQLRAKLLTGSGALYLRRALPDGIGTTSSHALWWPPAKVVAPHLAQYVERVDYGQHGPAPEPTIHVVLAQGDPVGGLELLGA